MCSIRFSILLLSHKFFHITPWKASILKYHFKVFSSTLGTCLSRILKALFWATKLNVMYNLLWISISVRLIFIANVKAHLSLNCKIIWGWFLNLQIFTIGPVPWHFLLNTKFCTFSLFSTPNVAVVAPLSNTLHPFAGNETSCEGNECKKPKREAEKTAFLTSWVM